VVRWTGYGAASFGSSALGRVGLRPSRIVERKAAPISQSTSEDLARSTHPEDDERWAVVVDGPSGRTTGRHEINHDSSVVSLLEVHLRRAARRGRPGPLVPTRGLSRIGREVGRAFGTGGAPEAQDVRIVVLSRSCHRRRERVPVPRVSVHGSAV
jgi:hypothetical protein